MNLGRARVAKQLYYSGAGRSSYDRVVDENHPLALYGGGDGVKLYSYEVLSCTLTGCDKGPAYILVLYKSYSLGNAGLCGISDSRVKSRIGNADYHVCLNGMSL